MTTTFFSKFKDYSLTPTTFSQDDIEKIRHAFDKYDLNQNGTVNLLKLIFVFNLLGQSITEQEILMLLDSSISGKDAHESESILHSGRLTDSVPSTSREHHGNQNNTYAGHSTRSGINTVIHTGNNSGTNLGSPLSSQQIDYSKVEIPFHVFLSMLSKHREFQEGKNGEQDLLDTFVSLGGETNGSGYLKYKKLRELCEEFELDVEVHEFLKAFDNENGKVRYESFKKSMGAI